MISWVSASSFLLVIAGFVAFVALSRLNQRSATPINAEIFASDVVDVPLAERAEGQAGGSASSSAPVAQVYKIRKGRAAIFAVAALSLLIALLTAFAAPFTSISWWLPLVFLGATVAGLVNLRVLALRDIKRRARENSLGRRADPPAASSRAHQPVVRSAEKTAPEIHRAYRPAPVASAAKNLRYARTHRESHRPLLEHEMRSGQLQKVSAAMHSHEHFEKVEATRWQPVAVPTPTYLDAEVVYREVQQITVDAEPTIAASNTLEEAATRGAVLNLDEVLNRRRA